MDLSSINANTFILKDNNNNVIDGKVICIGKEVIFEPLINLEYNSLYTIVVTRDVKDLAGNSLAENYVSSFTTIKPSDTTSPIIQITVPENNDQGISINLSIIAVFSENIDPLSINKNTFIILDENNYSVEGNVSYSNGEAIFIPLSNFNYNSKYIVKITASVLDLAGNNLMEDYVWSFTTETNPDNVHPELLATEPANNEINVAIDKVITLTFSEALDSSSVNNNYLIMRDSNNIIIASSIKCIGNKVTITLLSNFEYSAQYTIIATIGIRDLYGNTLSNNYLFAFKTIQPPDTTPPYILTVSPDNGAINIPINTNISVVFSEEMDGNSINTSTFYVKAQSDKGTEAQSISGGVTYANKIATFKPYSAFEPNITYTVTITNGIKDIAGNIMGNDYIWSFATPDTITPTVMSISPTNGEKQIPVDTEIQVVYSEAMDSASINANTFVIVETGLQPVLGTITYSGNIAIFTPSQTLESNTTYTVTIPNRIKDLAGNALAQDYIFSFTTQDLITPKVISTSPANGAGSVSIDSIIAITFSEDMDGNSINTSTFYVKAQSDKGTEAQSVSGTVTYNNQIAIFSQVSSLDPNTIYTITVTNGVKDLIGNNLNEEYIFSFTTQDIILPQVISTSPANGTKEIPVNTEIAISFSEDMDEASINSNTFYFSEGIAGIISYNNKIAKLMPLVGLENNRLYTVKVTKGVRDLFGNNMAGEYVFTFKTTDTIPPQIISTSPEDGMKKVPLNTRITIVFSEDLDENSINTSTFYVKAQSDMAREAQSVIGEITYNNQIAILVPNAELENNTTYMVTVKNGIKDLAGNALLADYIWSFTTIDTIAPTVVSVSPAKGAKQISVNTEIRVLFSEAMDSASINETTIEVRSQESVVETGLQPVLLSGIITYSDKVAIFRPSVNLNTDTVYIVIITNGIKDLAGNTLLADYIWSFTTIDTIAPQTVSVSPVNGTNQVPVDTKIQVLFSEAMDSTSIKETSFQVEQAEGLRLKAEGEITYNNKVATFTPITSLNTDTMYTVTITNGVKDLVENALDKDYTWSFTTIDTISPQVVSVSPANGATQVPVDTEIRVLFSEGMDSTSINAISFYVKAQSDKGTEAQSVIGEVTYANKIATFKASSAFEPNATYIVTITNGVKDLVENALDKDYVWSFATIDTIAPTVVTVSPANEEKQVLVDTEIRVVFNEAMDSTSINATSFKIVGADLASAQVEGIITYSDKVATFKSTTSLNPDTIYMITITTGAKDSAGNNIEINYTWNFTTIDTIPPQIVSVSPADRVTDVSIDTEITAVFSEAIDSTSINETTFQVMGEQ